MYFPIIGLEVHIQLKTKSKMFCVCPNVSREGTPPNQAICPICLGHPGTLPTINREAVEYTLKTALALHSQIPETSHFDRKNYFYPDLPKGYQISQYEAPLSKGGYLEIPITKEKSQRKKSKIKDLRSKIQIKNKKIRIRRIHLEEDTGRLIHPEGKDYSLIDFNRAGVPLMELVSEPDLRSAQEAKMFCQELQLILRYLNVSDADMEKGEMRCEVNISLLPKSEMTTEGCHPEERSDEESRGSSVILSEAKNPVAGGETTGSFANAQDDCLIVNSKLGTKVEIKNLNSFRAVERSVDYEIKRQSKILESQEKVVQETRGWDERRGVTVSQRTKEEAHDYRYFPEPDLPPLHFISDLASRISHLASSLPELPQAKRQRFQEEYSFSLADAYLLTQEPKLANWTEKVISELKAWLVSLEEVEGTEEEIWEHNKKKLAELVGGWLTSKLFGLLTLKRQTIQECKITPENFAEFIVLISQNKISSRIARVVLEEMVESGTDPSHILEEKDLTQISGEKELTFLAQEIIRANPEPVADYKKGKIQALKFLMGQVMKETGGKANPQIVERILKEELSKAI